MRRKTTAALILVLAFALIAGACSGGAGGEYDLVESGKILVCSDIPYPPFEFEEGAAYTGFDVELMEAIGAELELDVEFIDSGFESITNGTAMVGNSCDIAASAITIRPDREENIDFSDGYFDADQSLMVKTDSGITSLTQMDGLSLGVQSGTTGEAYAEENAPAGAEIVGYGESGQLFLAMEADAIQGILQDLPVNAERLVTDDTLTVVETYPTGEVYGFAVKEEGKEALLEAVNDALATLRSNGTYDTIYDKWFK
ncbi:MAG: transporter substrate-binding domain-containing protein [Acidimicrobiia bacterium]|nr:transporter substrate-binding domain-containing protein [Acidimicrobiia bacterium]